MTLNEKTLPIYIQKDINALKAYHNGTLNHPEDCLYCELEASINSAQHGFEISKEIADYLRAKYLNYDNGVKVEYYFNVHSIYKNIG